MITHPLEPLYDEKSKILVLGSFPSPKSRQMCFYYGHPQNRFWKVMAYIFNSQVPETIEEKKTLMRSNGIALWDVIMSCDIQGASDSSIKNAEPVDLNVILKNAGIEKICLNGRTAEKYFNRFLQKSTDLPVCCLPSTSPANAVWTFERLAAEWERGLKI